MNAGADPREASGAGQDPPEASDRPGRTLDDDVEGDARAEEAEEADETAPGDGGGQVSEGGGAFSGSEADLGGADAVPDKTSGSATGRRHQTD